MKKNYQEKMIVKEWVVLALIELMKNKSFQKISITELSKKAGIPRSTFYYYFNDKDDVLLEYSRFLTELLAVEYRKQMNNPILVLFEFLKKHQDYLKVLIQNKKDYIIFNTIKKNILLMNDDRKKQIMLNYQIGGLCNVIIDWIKTDFKESPEEMTHYLTEIMNLQLIDESFSLYISTFNKL